MIDEVKEELDFNSIVTRDLLAIRTALAILLVGGRMTPDQVAQTLGVNLQQPSIVVAPTMPGGPLVRSS